MKTTMAFFETDAGNEVTATVAYYPGDPGRWYMPNGDPGYPPEPPEVEIYDCYVNGNPYEPSDIELCRWEEKVMESVGDYFHEMDEDPTPWCHACGSMTITGCKCPDPFYSENH